MDKKVLRAVAGLFLAIFLTTGWAQDKPQKSEFKKIDSYLKRLEAKASKYGDKPFKLSYDERETLKKITKLGEKYPQDEEIQKLLERANQAIPWYFKEGEGEKENPAEKPSSASSGEKKKEESDPPKKEGPSQSEISRAEHFLKLFEKKVQKSRGEAFQLGYFEQESLERISRLHQEYPENRQVEELFQRTRKAILASKGNAVEITPQMLSFRENEKKLRKSFADEAEKEWLSLKENVLRSKEAILSPFPTISHREAAIDEMTGRQVILEGFEYPGHEFSENNQQFVFVGSYAQGFYYVELSSRAWFGAYEAVKRYRRSINSDLPENLKWSVVGRITGLELLVPEAGNEKTASVAWGWTVEPLAIYIPGYTLATFDSALPLGGKFAGEDRAEELKGPMYSVKSIPQDVSPERLVEIFSIAIREKNYPLYLECIDPDRRKGPKALQRCAYHWDWHQFRFSRFYVHIVVEDAKIVVLQGFDASNELENLFLTEEDKARIKKISQELIEQAEVKTRAYDEKGRQYGSPKPFFLKRKDKGRWYIVNYPQPF